MESRVYGGPAPRNRLTRLYELSEEELSTITGGEADGGAPPPPPPSVKCENARDGSLNCHDVDAGAPKAQ